MENNSNHLSQENIDRLNEIIDILGIDPEEFVDTIVRIRNMGSASSNILNAVKQLLWNHRAAFIDEAAGLVDLLDVMHPLIYKHRE